MKALFSGQESLLLSAVGFQEPPYRGNQGNERISSNIDRERRHRGSGRGVSFRGLSRAARVCSKSASYDYKRRLRTEKGVRFPLALPCFHTLTSALLTLFQRFLAGFRAQTYGSLNPLVNGSLNTVWPWLEYRGSRKPVLRVPLFPGRRHPPWRAPSRRRESPDWGNITRNAG